MSFQAKNIQHFIAKPGEAVYFTFSRGVFRTLSNVETEFFGKELTVFTC